jgi:hypothetical protein
MVPWAAAMRAVMVIDPLPQAPTRSCQDATMIA